jgi:hypothetical protein
MILFKIPSKPILIWPGEPVQVAFWTNKLRITVAQLNEAIIETGSNDLKVIKSYLIRNGVVFSFIGICNYHKERILKIMLNKFKN